MMHQLKITGETPFRIDEHAFCVVSPDAFTLNFSADGCTWTAWDSGTNANENLMVVFFARGTWFKLVGNTAEVIITY